MSPETLRDIILKPQSGIALYRQLADSIHALINQGQLQNGERLPATRELAAQLGLNRATVSAAYGILEQSGVLQGHVGRGSFVSAIQTVKSASRPGVDWDEILPSVEPSRPFSEQIRINLASSRPASSDFPLDAFRRITSEVANSSEIAQILQLGSPYGYAPLRRYLLEQSLAEGTASASDDLLITNGCQQALDLLARVFLEAENRDDARAMVLESPAYPGVLRVFSRTKAQMISVPVDAFGLNVDVLAQVLGRVRPRLLIVTPNFQNPTGATLTLERRRQLLELARKAGVVVVENDIYSDLRFQGEALPTLKQLDEYGHVVLLRSYSKIAFPGLRVGWILAPRPVIARLSESKQFCDLHSDQLAQAILLRFAESGELSKHLEQTRQSGLLRLQAALAACAEFLPNGSTFTRPLGGMSLWVELPSPVNAENVLSRAEDGGVSFLPGSVFSNRPNHRRALRLSFGALTPNEITEGIRLVAKAAADEIAALAAQARREPMAALV